MQDFEKLGTFYLGRKYELANKKLLDDMILYDARDLVTHAVVVGMTGSGKTGLCIDLIEEAAIDGVPSILIDPKGDLTNLLLNFPQLRGEDFLPWINADDAARKGLSPQDFANQQAATWAKGTADWGQSGERIQRLRDSAEFVIYTPGSNAGIPVSILKSFAVPPMEIMEDGELLQDRISTTVTSLLGLLNITAAPLQSREHILLSSIIAQMWQQGQDMDLATLIAQVQKPPMAKVGVLDVESFYPSKERFSLVMALNNLLASPAFASWLEGTPLDIGEILHTQKGKPRVAIFSIAHLGDAERMFFVSLLLNQILGWMRTQPGTTSLRALVYMDEIFGYFPPIANPPSKKPLLTLLKQARAFGVGFVLATQNPVDLDYKGLSNTGTWFIGRLQTERDKARVMEGLEGAAASGNGTFDRQKMEEMIAGLGNRVFLMNNAKEDGPVTFQTRFCLSYLRGPMTRSQIKQLMDPFKAAHPEYAAAQATGSTGAAAVTGGAGKAFSTAPAAAGAGSVQPTLPSDVEQYFLPLRGSTAGVTYQPMLLGTAKVRFMDIKTRINSAVDAAYITSIVDEAVPVDWEAAEEAVFSVKDLEKSAARGALFGDLPSVAVKSKNYADWARDFSTWLYGSQKIDLLRSPSTGQVSQPGEDERTFRVRIKQSTCETRDDLVEELRKKYAVKIAALEEKVRKAQQAVDREKSQAQQSGMQTALSFGATLLSAFTGRKIGSAAASSLKGVGRTMGQQGDVNRANDTVKTYQQQLQDLEAQFKEESDALTEKTDPITEELETLSIRPKKTDISVQLVALVWAPYRTDARGNMSTAW